MYCSSSGTVRAGTEGCTTSTLGSPATKATGTSVALGSKLWSGALAAATRMALLCISSVWPSAGARATGCAAISPPAPVRFSATTGTPRRGARRSAISRARMSVMPPAA